MGFLETEISNPDPGSGSRSHFRTLIQRVKIHIDNDAQVPSKILFFKNNRKFIQGTQTRLPKKPSLRLFSIPIPKFSISFAMKRDRKGDKSHPFLKPAYNSLKNSTAQIFSEIIFFKVKIKNTQFSIKTDFQANENGGVHKW